MDLYQEQIMEHYHNPRNAGTLANPDFSSGQQNPSCGDDIIVEGKVEDNKLVDVRFRGKGCILSQAAASMITEACKGKPLDDILKLDAEFVRNLLGIQLGPTRITCALLPLMALQQGAASYKKEHEG